MVFKQFTTIMQKDKKRLFHKVIDFFDYFFYRATKTMVFDKDLDSKMYGGRCCECASSWLKTMNLEFVPAIEGTQGKIKIAEKKALYTYYFRHGHLPPGNRIFR